MGRQYRTKGGEQMKYDFTSIMERHGKDAIAVDGLGTLCMPVCVLILKTLMKKLEEN